MRAFLDTAHPYYILAEIGIVVPWCAAALHGANKHSAPSYNAESVFIAR